MEMWWCIFGIIPVLEGLSTADQLPICPDICECDHFITNCQSNDLSQIPSEINSNVTSLDLSWNSFQNFSIGSHNFDNLKYLNLSHNKIATLGHTDFSGLDNLERLDLTFNLFHDWKDIHPQALSLRKKLTFLDMSNNPLRTIPQFSSHFPSNALEILKLNNCTMITIPLQVFNNMLNLKELHLARNPVSAIDGAFILANLKYLDLSNGLLETVNENVIKRAAVLETLVLSNNKHLRNLTLNSDSLLYLDLADSNLETVPEGNLRAVTVLNLQGNFLKVLTSNSFSNYPNLLRLNISLNAISLVRDNAFRGLDSVQIIDLSLNKITVISEKVFLPTISLIELNLSHNYLSSLDTITSSSLRTLSASHCEIYTVSRHTLSNLPKLKKLSLARNFISSLPDDWAADRLVTLDLSGCRIKTINNKTFEQMTYLRNINLSGNRLTSVELSYFHQIVYISLEDNQWRCECPHLKSIFEWLLEIGERVDALICDAPEKFEGMTWRNACQNEWYPDLNKKNSLWWYSVGVVVSMTILLVAVVILRRISEAKEKRLQEVEDRRRSQERDAREALQRMQRLQREFIDEGNRNAPDPRESPGPPSYTDALLLPRIDASHPSLAGSLHSIASRHSQGSNNDINKKGKVRRKRRRRKSELSDSRRQSRATIDDSDTSDQERPPQPPLESDF